MRDTRRADRFHSHLAGSHALTAWLAGTDDRPPPPHDRQQIAAILPAMLGIIGPDQIRRLLRHGMAEGLPRILLRQIALAIAHHPDLEPDAAMALLDQLPDTAGSLRHMALLRVLRRADRPDLVCVGLARFPDSEALWRLRFAPALRRGDEAEIIALIDEMTAVAEGIAAEDPTGWHARALALAERHESVIELLEDGPGHVPGGSNALIWARAVLAQGDLRRIIAAGRAARQGGLGAMGERIVAILDGIDALGIDRAGLENLPHDLFAPIIARAPAPYVPAADAPVLVVTSSLAAGGAERQTAATVNALDGFDGRRVILAAASLDPDKKHDFFLLALRENDRPVIDLSQIAPVHAEDNFEQTVLSVMPPDIARFASRLCQQIRTHRPALIHSWQDTTNIAAAIAALITGCPAVIMSGRSLRPSDRSRFRPYLRDAYRAFLVNRRFGLINNSRAGADDYADWLGLVSNRIGVIENGYPLDEMRARTGADARQQMRREWGIPDDAPVMGGVMRLTGVKDPERFVDTAIRLCRRLPDFHAVLAGDGALEGRLTAMIADAALGGRIHLIGRVSPVEPVMMAFDVLFLSSLLEGLPNVIIEAQALGIPVAATDVGGVAEALAPAPLGLLLPEDAPDLLARRIAAFMQERRADPETARRLAAFVDARFSVAAMAEKTRSAYRQAMAEATRRTDAYPFGTCRMGRRGYS